jgi:hypothetical protein
VQPADIFHPMRRSGNSGSTHSLAPALHVALTLDLCSLGPQTTGIPSCPDFGGHCIEDTLLRNSAGKEGISFEASYKNLAPNSVRCPPVIILPVRGQKNLSLAFGASGCAFLQWPYLANREVDKSLTRGFNRISGRKGRVRTTA